jgi:hypothetical protein
LRKGTEKVPFILDIIEVGITYPIKEREEKRKKRQKYFFRIGGTIDQ